MQELDLHKITQPARRLNGQRPVIAVTGPRRIWKFAWWATRWRLWRLGARAFYLCPGQAQLPERLHGMIIGGGNDIDPTHYGATGAAGAIYDAERDSLELQMIALAEKWSLPVLGICRGAQLINVFKQGNLLNDLRPLRKKTPNRNSLFAVKYATIDKQSKLHAILQTSRVKVNSLHNQAVDQVGESLRAVAFDDDGFVQAIEGIGERYLVGVQWHPEYLPCRTPQTRLFASLKQAALEYAQD